MPGIVVGVDGSEGSKHALAWAAEEARLRHAPLAVVLAWQLPATFDTGAAWVHMSSEVIDDVRKLAQQRLDDVCSELASLLEGVDVDRRVVEGATAPALIEAAENADLLVVGTRGHGGFAGLLLGSVSQQCAHHSPCPIVIIPPRPNA